MALTPKPGEAFAAALVMDLTRPVTYRNFEINTPLKEGTNTPIDGCQIDDVRFYPVDGYGYREKRSQSDGLDASDVFLGGRTVRFQGTLYGKTRGDLFDTLAEFRAAFSPTAAFAEGPGDLGYLPLNFEDATLDLENYPTGFIEKMMRMRPLGTPETNIVRDRVGGVDQFGYSIGWVAMMEARDPRIYAQSPVEVFFDATGSTNAGSGTVINRGAYPAPLKVEMFVSSAGADRVIELTAFGSVVKLTVPGPSGTDRVLRYDGVEKWAVLEEEGSENLRMDLLDFPAGLQHPLVPAGESSFSWTSKDIGGDTKNVNALSRFFFWEAWS